MSFIDSRIAPYAEVAVKLLQGPLGEEKKELWEMLLAYQVELGQYFIKIALELIIDERDGYAYLKEIPIDEAGKMIGLIRRQPLPYDQSLVCCLLLEWLLESESTDLDTVDLIITPKKFRERMEFFFKERSNQFKFLKDLNGLLQKVANLGLVKRIYQDPNDTDRDQYEVKRVLKAKITIEELQKFKSQLENE